MAGQPAAAGRVAARRQVRGPPERARRELVGGDDVLGEARRSRAGGGDGRHLQRRGNASARAGLPLPREAEAQGHHVRPQSRVGRLGSDLHARRRGAVLPGDGGPPAATGVRSTPGGTRLVGLHPKSTRAPTATGSEPAPGRVIPALGSGLGAGWGAMRILMVNKYAHVTGGADVNCLGLAEALVRRGHDIALLSTASPQNLFDEGEFIEASVTHASRQRLGAARQVDVARRALWNPSAARAMRHLVGRFRPQVVHAHKLYPQLSVAPVVAAAQAGLPIVQTLHDYELMSASYLDHSGGRVDRD